MNMMSAGCILQSWAFNLPWIRSCCLATHKRDLPVALALEEIQEETETQVLAATRVSAHQPQTPTPWQQPIRTSRPPAEQPQRRPGWLEVARLFKLCNMTARPHRTSVTEPATVVNKECDRSSLEKRNMTCTAKGIEHKAIIPHGHWHYSDSSHNDIRSTLHQHSVDILGNVGKSCVGRRTIASRKLQSEGTLRKLTV
jgi:hypothetical protein